MHESSSIHPAPGVPLVYMRGIGKHFGANRVLREVDFSVHRGECHVLAGENGAGKSTLINILGGVITDYEGAIEIAGQPARPCSPLHAAQLGISVIHQELSLIPAMSIADNLLLAQPEGGWALTRRLGLIAERDRRHRARRLLERVGLSLDVWQPAGDLPIACQQLLEIAKALAFDARVLVMDEPTSALPADDVERISALVERLKAEGRGVVYITHKMEEIGRLADRITVLRDGRVVGCAPAREMSPAALLHLMVGRELGEQIPYQPATPGRVRLSVRGLSVRPRGRAVNPPVRDVSFDLRGGEVLGLAGLQGSGNSELLLALFGAMGRRTSGEVLLDGAPVRVESPRSAMAGGLALLTNDRKATGLILSMSVIANATLADLPQLSPWGWRRPSHERTLAGRLAHSLCLRAPSLNVDVGTLSGGNQQKVALAKWLGRAPRVLLLDEPTRGVDVGAKREIYTIINDLKRRGAAILLISTELPELLGLCDRIAVMHRGRIAATLDRPSASPERILSAAMGEAPMHREEAGTS